ncbi:alcohol dehydrogenase catalytic domain-containing protein [Rhodococcus opacus]|nr:alcohol dehydrogenase catalytic domain-containing protein [Rhodococcus opacus]
MTRLSVAAPNDKKFAAPEVSMRNVRAVFAGGNDPIQFMDVDVTSPPPGGMNVRVVLAGVCGTDAHRLSGDLPVSAPVGFGHEGVGVVEELGPGTHTDWAGQPLVPVTGSTGSRQRAAVSATSAMSSRTSVPVTTFSGLPPRVSRIPRHSRSSRRSRQMWLFTASPIRPLSRRSSPSAAPCRPPWGLPSARPDCARFDDRGAGDWARRAGQYGAGRSEYGKASDRDRCRRTSDGGRAPTGCYRRPVYRVDVGRRAPSRDPGHHFR